ncbi:MAG: hypothetical protein JSV80_02845 [Acidobacteriota bacterium]|nr:MAG: hypothetical protein JSV80_02845 [Acidobacteriota bacterium]
MTAKTDDMTQQSQPRRKSNAARRGWQPPAVEWEEPYEPVAFAASCTSQPFNCGAGAQG